VSQCDQETLNN